VTERCERYGVSRQTGDTWIDRDLTYGPQGLDARSRRPSTVPRHTPDQVGAAILDARRKPPSWGATQLVALFYTHHPRWPWPARSTVCAMLSRQGLVPKKRKRRVIGPPGTPTSAIDAPNDVWRADCTGPFKTGDGHDGDPLTSTAGDRRFLLSGQALSSTSVAAAKPVFMRVFKAFGLPRRIRPDHGVPVATNTLARLSQWSAWWLRLGILPECIEPGQPPQNGRHERRPRTLNADTTRPPGANLRAQPQKFNHVRDAFNHERPHEGLDRRTPAACSEPAPRAMPHKPPPFEDPDRFEVRDVSANGGLRWNRQGGNVSTTCAGAYVGLEAIDEGVWTVDFGPLTRGRRLERHLRIEDA
jgi:transposase InsO family protein